MHSTKYLMVVAVAQPAKRFKNTGYTPRMLDMTKVAGSLLLLGFLGCHQDEPESVQRAKQKRYHEKLLFSDRASLLYAQQELGLAEKKAAAARLSGAALDVKLDADDLQTDEDLERWKSFNRVLAESQSQGEHR